MTKPYKYQKQGIRKIEHFDGRVLLADEMGLGKTLQCLMYMRRNHLSTMPAVVVCPASLKWNWAREAMQHIKCRAHVLEGRTPYPAGTFDPEHRLVVINYDILAHWLDWLEGINPQLVMIDECQYIKNMDAQRTQAVQQLCQGSPHVIGISGTPLTSRPAELFPILNILWPAKFNSFLSYGWAYCRPKKTPWGWQYKGAINLDELNGSLRESGMVRRLKADVLEQLPAKTRVMVPMELTPKDRAEYDYAETNFMRWLARSSGKAKAKKARKAQALVKVGYLKRLAAKLKLNQTMQWTDDFLDGTDEKLVLFGIHQAIIRPLVERYGKMCVLIDGSVTGRHRQHAVDAFQTKAKKRLLVGQLKSAGVGITLTAASNSAFCELGQTPGEHTQGEDRTHRIGQLYASMCYYLVAHNTIEEDLCLLLQKKQTVLDAVLDGGEVPNTLDIFDQLLKKIEHRRAVV